MKIRMKQIIIMVLFLVLIVLTAGCTVQETKVGLMSMKTVLNESKRADELQKELLEISSKLEENNQNEQTEASKKAQEEAYREFSTKKSELEKELNQEIDKVLGQITTEHNLDIILYKNNTYYGGIDITDDVIEKLDKKYYNQDEGASNEE